MLIGTQTTQFPCGHLGEPMSQEAAVAKLEAVYSNLWKERRVNEDGFDIACHNLLETVRIMDHQMEVDTTNDTLAQMFTDQLNMQSGLWKPMWEKKV